MEEKTYQQGLEVGIRAFIRDSVVKEKNTKYITIRKLMKYFDLDVNEAKEYFEKFIGQVTMSDVVDKFVELGRLEVIFESVEEGDYGIERGMEKTGLTREEFIEDMKKNGYKIPKIEYADGN